MGTDWASLLITLIAVIVASCGYAMIYKIPQRILVVSVLGAVIGWFTNAYFVNELGLAPIAAAFIAAMIIALYAEIMARRVKAPASIFLVIGVLPLVPGSSFYFAIEAAILGDFNQSIVTGLEAAGIALSLAMGMMVISTFVYLYYLIKNKIKARGKQSGGSLSGGSLITDTSSEAEFEYDQFDLDSEPIDLNKE